MKTLGTIVSVLSLGVIVALQGSAAALPCSAGCGQEKNACVQTARVARSACKQDCRANAEPTALGACMIGCSATYRSAKTDCQADHVSCQGACKPPAHPGPPSPPSNCLGTCGQDLATCTKGSGGTAEELRGGLRRAVGARGVSHRLRGGSQAAGRGLPVRLRRMPGHVFRFAQRRVRRVTQADDSPGEGRPSPGSPARGRATGGSDPEPRLNTDTAPIAQTAHGRGRSQQGETGMAFKRSGVRLSSAPFHHSLGLADT